MTLQLLKNHKMHTHIIDQIKNKVLDMLRLKWKFEFSWVKAHAVLRRKKPADKLAKEATNSRDIE